MLKGGLIFDYLRKLKPKLIIMKKVCIAFLLLVMIMPVSNVKAAFPTDVLETTTPVDDSVTTAVNVNEAVDAFKSLSRKERKDRVKDAKAALKAWKQNGENDTNMLLLVIVTILLPPLGVALYEKKITTKFWISLLLTLLFYLPGLIYSLLVIFGQA
jgi:uncharacterized membrane protein YqaE (UPF0057 family)